MAGTAPFDQNCDAYDAWFDRSRTAYEAELNAVRRMLPLPPFRGLEIGAGTGRFACRLGISDGVEPSESMARLAESRGLRVYRAAAEHLPFPDGQYDAALMVTVLCFTDDPEKSVREMFRVLRSGGTAVIGLLDPESPLGQELEQQRASSRFYRNARLFRVQDVFSLLTGAGFSGIGCCQTVFTDPARMQTPDSAREGFGDGLFVVIRALKPNEA